MIARAHVDQNERHPEIAPSRVQRQLLKRFRRERVTKYQANHGHREAYGAI